VLDLFPTEEVLPWRIVMADVLVVGLVALAGFWFSRQLSARLKAKTAGRRWLLRHAWVSLAAGVLFLRGFYGPPIRLLLTAEYDRCRQRLVDRLATSPAARAWTALHTIEWLVRGVPEAEVPNFLYRDQWRLGEAGFQRLDDQRLVFRLETIAQGFANPEQSGCGTDGWNFLDVLWRVNPRAREVWFDMTFDAIVAEILEQPAVREVGEEERVEILTTLATARLQRLVTGTGESPRLARCREVERLYAMACELKGHQRVVAARLLAVDAIGAIDNW